MYQSLAATLLVLAGSAIATPFPQNYVSSGQCPAGCGPIYSEHDHPDPHQIYQFEQLTRNQNCGDNPGCEISKSEIEGQSITVGASMSGDGWISAGFEVAKYQESGEANTCYGDPEDTICVFARTAMTMYGVSVQSNECCRAGEKSDTTITSPNKNGLGSAILCAKNEQCHGKGHKYQNNMEQYNKGSTWASGPVEWPFDRKLTGLVPELEASKTD